MKNLQSASATTLAVAVTSAIPLFSAALPAGAQALEEIVVTAQRREQSIQDIPMSVTAFSGDQLDVRQIGDILDLQFSVPNLLVDGLRTSIRGVGNNAISSTSEDGLGYHVNDVYVNAPLFSTSEYFDIERVEVLRAHRVRSTDATRPPASSISTLLSLTRSLAALSQQPSVITIRFDSRVRLISPYRTECDSASRVCI